MKGICRELKAEYLPSGLSIIYGNISDLPNILEILFVKDLTIKGYYSLTPIVFTMNLKINLKEFVKSLFDISLKQHITPKIVSIVYLMVLFVSIVAVFPILISGFGMLFSGEPLLVIGGLFLIILSPVLYLTYVVLMRVMLETVIILFQIEANTRPQRSSALEEEK